MDTTTDEVTVGLLGPVSAQRAGRPINLGSPKQRAVFAMLALRTGDPIDRDALLTGTWGDDVGTERVGSLHTYVSNLRSVLGGLVEREHRGYRLTLGPEAIDALRFARTIDEARTSLIPDPSATAERLRTALAWWRGRPLADLDDIPGLEPDIRRLEQLRVDAVELRVEADLLIGRHEAVVGELAALASEHPLRERFRAQQMVALYRCGRQVEALRAYRESVRYLDDELGLTPSPELQRLELAILGHDDELLVGPRQPTTQRLAVLVIEVDVADGAWDAMPQTVGEALSGHDATYADIVSAHGGRLARSASGGSVAVFPDIVRAVAAAEQLVHLVERDDRTRELVGVRLGIDVGDVEVGGSTIKGPPATRAHRLCAVANTGQVLLSAAASRDLAAGNRAGVQIRMLGEHELYGFPTPERVGQLVVEGLRAKFPQLRPDIGEHLGASITHELPGYELRGRLSEESFGSVYRAYHPAVGREVTVKVIPPEFAEHPAFARHFEVEARAIARLTHPHVLPIIDFWRNSDGAFLVRQLVHGQSLSQVAPSEGDARRILRQLAGALDHVHAHGVVHGDLRPENVIIDQAGNAYLTDFGIALRHLEAQIGTQAEAVPYRAPEEAATGPSAAGDRYALGVLARSLILDEATEPILARATAAAADERHATASAFIVDLEESLGYTAESDDQSSSRTSPSSIRNPYKGMRAFDEADGADFHGRDDLVAELVAAVTAERFVTVIGASGSGKSSLVRAGLLPSLGASAIPGSDSWEHAVVTPGTDPTTAVHEALASCSGAVVLVIDQFEELYTLVDSDEARQGFIDLLLGVLDDIDRDVRVVATLRADFFDRPLSDVCLARIITRALITVLPPDPQQLRAMIAIPAHSVGLRWEPGLVNRIARDVESAPGALPLLQFALTELVERRHGDLLTESDYEGIGGVADAVGRRAEAAYKDLSVAGREVARTIMLRLVTVDEDGVGEARRRVRRSELDALGLNGHEVQLVLEAFVSDRLLLADRDPVTRGPTVEVAHEALLRAWPRLRDWIDAERGALMMGRRFRSALTDWEAADRDPEYLVRGNRLAVFDDWSVASTLSESEREFHDACTAAESAVWRSRRRRRRTIVALLVTVAVVTSTLGVVAVVQARRAEQQAQVARARELTSAAVAALDTDPELAGLLALAAADTAEPTADTISVLRRATSANRLSARHAWPDSIDHMVGIALSPDGTLAAYAGPLVRDPDIDRLEVRDVATWSVLWSIETRSYGVDGIWFAPDSTKLVTGLSTWTDEDVPRGVRVYGARSGEIEATHGLGRCGATVSDVTSTTAIVQVWPPVDGSCTWEGAEVDPLSSLELVDLVDGEVTLIEPEILDAAPKLDDAGRLATFAVDEGGPRIVVIELATGRRILEIGPDEFGLDGGPPRELSPDGSMLVAGHEHLVVIDVASGRAVSRFDEHGARPHSVMWTPGGSSVWSVAADGSVFEWDPFDASIMTDLPAQGGSGDLRVSRGGVTVLVDDLNSRSMSVLEPRGSAELWRADICDDGGQARDGSLAVVDGVAVAAFECVDGIHTAQIDDAGSVTTVLPAPASGELAIHPTGLALARREKGVDGDAIVLRDTRLGDVVVELIGSSDVDSRWIEFSPDGRIVLAIGAGDVHGWDATNGALLGSIDACGFISDVAFRPDTDELVIGCFEEPLAIVSSATWSIEARPNPAVGHYPTFPGYSADGGTLLVLNGGTGATSMTWLDAETYEVIDRLDEVHVGAPTAWTMSPSRSLAATASSDGFVKVWNVVERRQVDELYFEGGASGVAFASEDELLVATDRGIGASTLDPSEFLRTARSSTTRDFTRAECDRYDLGADCGSDEESELAVSSVAP